MHVMQRLRAHSIEIAVPAAVLAALIAWSEAAGSFYYPAAGKVATAFSDAWISSGFTTNVVPSLWRLFGGYALALVVGVAAGVLLAEVTPLRRTVAPVVEFVRALPAPALVPVFILAIGVGELSKILIIATGCVWPILLNTLDGVLGVDRGYLSSARAYRIGPLRRLTRVSLPAAMPQIAAGMQTSLSIALIMVIVSELLASTNGIGYFIGQAQSNFDMPAMWAGIVLIGILGFVLNHGFVVLERRLLSWHFVEEDAE
jgi:ABC-type nitrate/sulfonate/bicarbonate transport system permease component